jgi:hypothetical protein
MTTFGSRHAAVAAVIAGALVLAACGGTVMESESAGAASHGCIDDSKACIDQRQAHLKALLSDKSRKWVREPATTGSYATGVRLYAFKTEKARLSCEELSIGRREADNAPGALRGPSGKGLPTPVIARGVIFAGEVAKELNGEAKRRCKA